MKPRPILVAALLLVVGATIYGVDDQLKKHGRSWYAVLPTWVLVSQFDTDEDDADLQIELQHRFDADEIQPRQIRTLLDKALAVTVAEEQSTVGYRRQDGYWQTSPWHRFCEQLILTEHSLPAHRRWYLKHATSLAALTFDDGVAIWLGIGQVDPPELLEVRLVDITSGQSWPIAVEHDPAPLLLPHIVYRGRYPIGCLRPDEATLEIRFTIFASIGDVTHAVPIAQRLNCDAWFPDFDPCGLPDMHDARGIY
ncbi:MAG: hypothetical protein AAF432_04595 [Planctomycetota bacterium]